MARNKSGSRTARWTLVEEIFNGALDRPPAERADYVDGACGEDSDVRREVLSLLAFDQDAESVLREVVVEDVNEWVSAPESTESGTYVGPYLLVRELDSGGMGIVHLAVRSDDQYFQIVAIKTLRKEFATRDLIQRFRAERQILATLTHPNVGAILDGGVTEDGRPFMVMEYVEGQSITGASKALGLSIRQRIELFRSVCGAVHYAHQKLIIHRDIKPANVLVTPEGVAKLIDFGIAKSLVEGLLPAEQAATLTNYRPMTPDYASPEQLVGQPLTLATDIYSLGILLFELLTDVTPYSLKDLSLTAAEKLVLSGVRTKPSAMTHLDARTRKELAGDLDRIVLMALEVDPARRYPSVKHLDDDLGRYLEGRPVAARQSSHLYNASKLLKRHKAITVTICGSLIMLAVILGAYTVHSRRADRKVEQISKLADATIAQMADQIQQASNSTETQAALFHQVLEFLHGLDSHTGDDPRLYLELSKAYLRVGDLEGSPSTPNLGNSSTAISSYQSSLNMAMRAHDLLPNDESTIAVIKAHQHLGEMHSFLGDIRAADEEFQRTLAWALPFWKKNPRDPVRTYLLANVYAGTGDTSLSRLRPDQALDNFSAAFKTLDSGPNGEEDHDRLLIGLQLRYAFALNELGRHQEALRRIEQGIQLAEALAHRSSSLRTRHLLLRAYSHMVLVLSGRDVLNVSDSGQAQIYAQKVLTIAKSMAASDPKNAQAGFDLSTANTMMGDAHRQVSPRTAARWYRKSIVFTKTLRPRYESEATHRLAIEDEALAEVLIEPSQSAERLRLLQEADVLRDELSDRSPHGRLHLMRSHCRLSDARLAVNDFAGAARESARALPMLAEFDIASPSLLVLREVGACLHSLGDLERRSATDSSLSSEGRQAARSAAHSYYERSAKIWDDFARRGAATPESERERRRVQFLLSR